MVGTTHRVSCYLHHPGLVQLCLDGVPRVCAYSITVEESPAWLGDDNRRSVSCDRFSATGARQSSGALPTVMRPATPIDDGRSMCNLRAHVAEEEKLGLEPLCVVCGNDYFSIAECSIHIPASTGG